MTGLAAGIVASHSRFHFSHPALQVFARRLQLCARPAPVSSQSRPSAGTNIPTTRDGRAALPERIGSKSPLFVDGRGEPLRHGGLQYLVETALPAAGVADRRTPEHSSMRCGTLTPLAWADDGASASASASEIMALLGHASLTTSQAYIDATAAEQRRSADADRTYRALTHCSKSRSQPTAENSLPSWPHADSQPAQAAIRCKSTPSPPQ
jgi:hypothetical protein